MKMREAIKRRKAPLLGSGFLIVVVAAAILILVVLGRPPSTTDSYFNQLKDGRLNEDTEKNLLLLQKPFLESPSTNFNAFEAYPNTGYKYSIAFTTYALANIAQIETNRAPACAQWIDNLIQKMLQRATWGDWETNGWGIVGTNLPVMKQNIMWKGHLNLMYALHIQCSGSDQKYGEDFRKLSKNIADEMEASKYGGACCQPINYYFQCNTVSMFSLCYHDLFYETAYRQKFETNWLNFGNLGKSRMLDPRTKLFYALYHPESDTMDERLSGYTNAWIIMFLHFFDPAWAEALYAQYKKTFIREILGFAYSSEAPKKLDEAPPMDALATLFALMVSKEMGDQDLFGKLLKLLSKAGSVQIDSANPELAPYRGTEIYVPSNVGIQGPLLFAKANIGITKLFELAKAQANRKGQ